MQDFKALKKARQYHFGRRYDYLLKSHTYEQLLTKESRGKILHVFDNQQLRDKLPSDGQRSQGRKQNGRIRGVAPDCIHSVRNTNCLCCSSYLEDMKSEEESRK